MGGTQLFAHFRELRVYFFGLVVFVLRASELFVVVELLDGLPVPEEDFPDLLLDVAGELLGLAALVLLLHRS